MATRTDYEIKGALEMERLLKELGPQLAVKVADEALRAGARVVVEEAKRLVPVDTGALRDSIVAQVQRKGSDEEREILIGFKVPHSRRAHLTEFGTAHSAAKPFMRPAMDAKASEALEEIGGVLAKGITREAEKLAKPGKR